MHYGLAWGTPYGAEEDMVSQFDFKDYGDGTGGKLTAKIAAGLGDQYYGLVMAGKVLYVVYMPEGIARDFSILFDQEMLRQALAAGGDLDFPLSLVPNSGYADATVADLTIPQQNFLADKARTVQLDFDCVIEVLSAYGDSGQFSNWTLTGLKRYLNGRPTGNKSQLKIDLVLVTISSVHYLSLQLGDLVIASGSRTGNGTIILAEENDSGLNGQTDLAFSADIADVGDAFVAARWAQKYLLHMAQVLTFPRTAESTVLDAGQGNRLSGRVGPLDPGTYDYVVQAESDTAVDGTNTAAAGSKAVPGRPKPPGKPVLHATPGNYSNTKIVVQSSKTAGATYIWRDMQYLDGPIDFHLSAATYPAVTPDTPMTLILPTLPGGPAAGTRRGSLEAVSGGITDGHRIPFSVEYKADGSIVNPRPNVPSFSVKAKSSRTLTIQYAYDRTNELGLGATIQLFLLRKGATIDWTSPAATASLAAGGRIRTGQISAVAAANDWYRYAIRIATAAGVQSFNTALQGPEWLSNAAPAAPANVIATLVG